VNTVEKQRSEEAKKQKSGEAKKLRTIKARSRETEIQKNMHKTGKHNYPKK